ncbi:MAG: glutaminyl-peptide cyclotransferase [Prevotellaceae bacterium]|nr:glutaminyl-peptide cyclotransferase [Prevotellaceae bacterium]
MGRKRAVLTSYRSGERLGVLSFAYTVKPPYPPKVYSYKVVKEYPHRRDAYTQGLFFHNGYLYEGTGQYGHSTLCKIDLQTGNVIHEIYLGNNYFGEGICLLNNYIYQLTWQEQVGFIYNADNFEKIGDFSYPTEGWGITTDGTYLIMSDGTNSLYFIDPANMATAKRIEVYSNSESVIMLNELEYINGEIWANVYGKDFIVIVDAKTGAVKGRIDLKNILKQEYYSRDTDVLNGIAHDIVNNRIFITGKNWPKLFEIEIVE